MEIVGAQPTISFSWYTNSSFSESWRYPSKITIFPDVADCKHKQQVMVISIGKCMIPGEYEKLLVFRFSSK